MKIGKKGEIARESMSVFGVARAREGRKKRKGREARSDRTVGHLSSSGWRFSCSVFPAAFVVGFGNVRGEIRRDSLVGSLENRPKSVSFLFRPCLFCRLAFRTACVCVGLRYARFREGERRTYERHFSGEPTWGVSNIDSLGD